MNQLYNKLYNQPDTVQRSTIPSDSLLPYLNYDPNINIKNGLVSSQKGTLAQDYYKQALGSDYLNQWNQYSASTPEDYINISDINNMFLSVGDLLDQNKIQEESGLHSFRNNYYKIGDKLYSQDDLKNTYTVKDGKYVPVLKAISGDEPTNMQTEFMLNAKPGDTIVQLPQQIDRFSERRGLDTSKLQATTLGTLGKVTSADDAEIKKMFVSKLYGNNRGDTDFVSSKTLESYAKANPNNVQRDASGKIIGIKDSAFGDLLSYNVDSINKQIKTSMTENNSFGTFGTILGIASMFIPGLQGIGSSILSSMGASSTFLASGLGQIASAAATSAVMNGATTAIGGGDLGDVFKAAATGALTGAAGSYISGLYNGTLNMAGETTAASILAQQSKDLLSAGFSASDIANSLAGLGNVGQISSILSSAGISVAEAQQAAQEAITKVETYGLPEQSGITQTELPPLAGDEGLQPIPRAEVAYVDEGIPFDKYGNPLPEEYLSQTTTPQVTTPSNLQELAALGGAGTAATGALGGAAQTTSAEILAQQTKELLAAGFTPEEVAGSLAGLGSADQIAKILQQSGMSFLDAAKYASGALTSGNSLLDLFKNSNVNNLLGAGLSYWNAQNASQDFADIAKKMDPYWDYRKQTEIPMMQGAAQTAGTVQDYLQKAYTDPVSIYNTPEMQALSGKFMQDITRQDAATGRASQYGARAVEAQNNFMSNLNQYKGTAGQNLSTLYNAAKPQAYSSEAASSALTNAALTNSQAIPGAISVLGNTNNSGTNFGSSLANAASGLSSLWNTGSKIANSLF